MGLFPWSWCRFRFGGAVSRSAGGGIRPVCAGAGWVRAVPEECAPKPAICLPVERSEAFRGFARERTERGDGEVMAAPVRGRAVDPLPAAGAAGGGHRAPACAAPGRDPAGGGRRPGITPERTALLTAYAEGAVGYGGLLLGERS
ncbi:hypothetical protein [Streptomyces sp. YGL11-2]|uniref:hypothetical protein n=1 Tax=Streptomyces sp. YGL11-2 TaxID=3414028 RepID=UPI003CFB1C51